jgi:hypothetical protein
MKYAGCASPQRGEMFIAAIIFRPDALEERNVDGLCGTKAFRS